MTFAELTMSPALKKTLQKNVARAKELLVRALDDVERSKRDVALAEKQFACAHENVHASIFGSTCKDCEYFFNDGF